MSYRRPVSRVYDVAFRGLSLGVGSSLHRLLATLPEVAPGAVVADIGCGTGLSTEWLLRAVGPEGRIAAIDPSAAMITEASRRPSLSAGPVDFFVGDAFTFAPDRWFDVVTFCLSLSVCDDPHGALAKAITWLRPDGRVVIIDAIPSASGFRPADLWIQLKAPIVGATPARARQVRLASHQLLDEATEQSLGGGLYTLIRGRVPTRPDKSA